MIEYGLAVSFLARALTSVSLIWGQLVTVNLAAICLYDSSAIGDCPAAHTGVSCYTVTAAGARCEFVASNSSSSIPAELG